VNAVVGTTWILQQAFKVKKGGIISLKADINAAIIKSAVKLLISALG